MMAIRKAVVTPNSSIPFSASSAHFRHYPATELLDAVQAVREGRKFVSNGKGSSGIYAAVDAALPCSSRRNYDSGIVNRVRPQFKQT